MVSSFHLTRSTRLILTHANEANLVSTQGANAQRVESEKADLEGRERSQSAAGGLMVRDAGRHDSHRLMEGSTNDSMGISPREPTDAAGGACPGDRLERSPDHVEKTPRKAPNEAISVSTQSMILQKVASKTSDPERRERSQSATGEDAVLGAGNDRIESIMPAGKGDKVVCVRTRRFSPAAASQTVVPDESGPPVAGTKPTLLQEATPPTRPKSSLRAIAAASILGIRAGPKPTSR